MSLQSYVENLPFELKEYIKEFLFVNCNKCKQIYLGNNNLKYSVYGYVSVFDDDWGLWLDDGFFNVYNFLCKKCIKYYNKKGFIVNISKS